MPTPRQTSLWRQVVAMPDFKNITQDQKRILFEMIFGPPRDPEKGESFFQAITRPMTFGEEIEIEQALGRFGEPITEAIRMSEAILPGAGPPIGMGARSLALRLPRLTRPISKLFSQRVPVPGIEDPLSVARETQPLRLLDPKADIPLRSAQELAVEGAFQKPFPSVTEEFVRRQNRARTGMSVIGESVERPDKIIMPFERAAPSKIVKPVEEATPTEIIKPFELEARPQLPIVGKANDLLDASGEIVKRALDVRVPPVRGPVSLTKSLFETGQMLELRRAKDVFPRARLGVPFVARYRTLTGQEVWARVSRAFAQKNFAKQYTQLEDDAFANLRNSSNDFIKDLRPEFTSARLPNRQDFREMFDVLTTGYRRYIKRIPEKEPTVLTTPRVPDLGDYERLVIFPHTVAKRWKVFEPIFREARSLFVRRDNYVSTFVEKIRPYFDLPEHSLNKVNEVLFEGTLNQVDYRAPNFQAPLGGVFQRGQKLYNNLNLQEKDAYGRVLDMFDSALEHLRDTLKFIGKDEQLVDEAIDEIKKTGFVPLSRWGEWAGIVRDRVSGSRVAFILKESEADLVKASNEWARKGYVVENFYAPKPKGQLFSDLDPITWNLLSRVEEETGVLGLSEAFAKIGRGGFPTHYIKRQDVLGFERDLKRGIADYIWGISNYMAHREARPGFAKGLGLIDESKTPGLFKYAQDYINYIESFPEEFSKLRSGLFYWHLGANIRGALVNLSQSALTTYPELSRFTKKPIQYLNEGLRMAIKDPSTYDDADLVNALNRATNEGIVSERLLYELLETAQKKPLLEGSRGLLSGLQFFFRKTELINRKAAFISAFNVARREMNLPIASAEAFAKSFVDRTQYIYGRVDRPMIGRGAGAPLLVFRTFIGNILSWMKELAKDGEYGAVARSLGVLGVFGGASAIPSAGVLEELANALGYDPRKEIKKALPGKLGDVLLNGALYPFGIDVSRSIGLGDIVPFEQERGLLRAGADLVGGAIAGDVGRLYYSLKLFRDGATERAVENLMPEFLRNPTVAMRWLDEGVRSPRTGELIVPNIKFEEAFVKALGFQPSVVSTAYAKRESQRLLAEQANNSSFYNRQLARAVFNDDEYAFNQIMNEIDEYNRNRPLEKLIIVDREAIRHYIRLQAGEETTLEERLRGIPRKGREEFLKIERVFQ